MRSSPLASAGFSRLAASLPPALPPAPLAVGSRGEIDGVPVTVEGHAVVEIARVDARFDRHEYHLSDGAGNSWLLAFGAELDQHFVEVGLLVVFAVDLLIELLRVGLLEFTAHREGDGGTHQGEIVLLQHHIGH